MARSRKDHHIRSYKTAHGTRYEVRVTVHGQMRKQGGIREFDAAAELRDQWLLDRHKPKDTTAQPEQRRMTVRKFLAEVYWPQHGSTLEQRTRDNYRRAIERQIVPDALGAMDFARVDTEEITLWQDRMRARGISDQQVRNGMKVLSKAFALGVQRSRTYGVKVNPCAGAEWPNPDREHEVHVFEPEVVEEIRLEILRQGRDDPDPDQAMLDALLLSYMSQTGARPGEARLVQLLEVGADEIEVPAAKSKTKKRRSLPKWKPLADDLDEVVKKLGLSPSDYLMTGSGEELSFNGWEDWRKRAYIPARDAVANRIDDNLKAERLRGARAYDICRHAFAAVAIDALWDIRTIAQIMGHSIETLAKHYDGRLEQARQSGKPIDPEQRVIQARKKVARELKKLGEDD